MLTLLGTKRERERVCRDSISCCRKERRWEHSSSLFPLFLFSPSRSGMDRHQAPWFVCSYFEKCSIRLFFLGQPGRRLNDARPYTSSGNGTLTYASFSTLDEWPIGRMQIRERPAYTPFPWTWDEGSEGNLGKVMQTTTTTTTVTKTRTSQKDWTKK